MASGLDNISPPIALGTDGALRHVKGKARMAYNPQLLGASQGSQGPPQVEPNIERKAI